MVFHFWSMFNNRILYMEKRFFFFFHNIVKSVWQIFICNMLFRRWFKSKQLCENACHVNDWTDRDCVSKQRNMIGWFDLQRSYYLSDMKTWVNTSSPHYHLSLAFNSRRNTCHNGVSIWHDFRSLEQTNSTDNTVTFVEITRLRQFYLNRLPQIIY